MIGGYGRGELFPHSDVDLLILTDRLAPEDAAPIEAFVSACWDLGLQIGHSVRSIDDCLDEARGDITVQTSLIERRLIVGNREAFDQLGDRLRAAYRTDRNSLLETLLSAQSFADALTSIGYLVDFANEDRDLALQIEEDQRTLATLHATVTETRTATDGLRIATAAQKAELDAQIGRAHV